MAQEYVTTSKAAVNQMANLLKPTSTVQSSDFQVILLCSWHHFSQNGETLHTITEILWKIYDDLVKLK